MHTTVNMKHLPGINCCKSEGRAFGGRYLSPGQGRSVKLDRGSIVVGEPEQPGEMTQEREQRGSQRVPWQIFGFPKCGL